MENPYQYHTPLQSPDAFVARPAEIMRIVSRIDADRPQSIALVGGPGSGKTSLINWLCAPQSRREYLDQPDQYTYLRLNLNEHPPQDPADFFAQVAAAQDGPQTMPPSYEGFSAWVKKLMQAKRKLVLFLDDFGAVTNNSRFPIDFFSFLRSMANSNDVGYVTTSEAPLQELCHTKGLEESPFFNIFTTMNLAPFKEDDARRLVEEPATAAGQPFGEEVDWILDLGGASPYLLCLTAHVAFALRAQGALDRRRLESEAFKRGESFLQLLWNPPHCSPAEQTVLKNAATGHSVEARLEYAAQALARRHLLRPVDSGYELVPGLLKRFVQSSEMGFWKRLFR
ncbi:MAG: AAA family ATPase [Candidatus Latescibacteria bacterium]|nr:AAA family ATPase [Candidatus Latescibacterota bacterium]